MNVIGEAFFMKKCVSSIIICSFLLIAPKGFTEEKPVGKAAIHSEMTASTIAWASFGIALLVAVGIIVAININHNHQG